MLELAGSRTDDQTDRRFVDGDKNITGIGFYTNHRTELMRRHNNFLRTHLNAVIGQAAAIFPARHPSDKYVFRSLREFLVAEPDLSGPDHDFTGIAGRDFGWRARNKR